MHNKTVKPRKVSSPFTGFQHWMCHKIPLYERKWWERDNAFLHSQKFNLCNMHIFLIRKRISLTLSLDHFLYQFLMKTFPIFCQTKGVIIVWSFFFASRIDTHFCAIYTCMALLIFQYMKSISWDQQRRVHNFFIFVSLVSLWLYPILIDCDSLRLWHLTTFDNVVFAFNIVVYSIL